MEQNESIALRLNDRKGSCLVHARTGELLQLDLAGEKPLVIAVNDFRKIVERFSVEGETAHFVRFPQ